MPTSAGKITKGGYRKRLPSDIMAEVVDFG
jgi:hypothetical protein